MIEQIFGQRFAYNANRPEVHEILRRWRRLADSYDPPRVLLGETDVHRLEMLPPFYGDGTDELHLAFNLPWLHAEFRADALRAVVEETERILPDGGLAGVDRLQPRHLPPGHPVGRRAIPGTIRCILLALLTLRGTPVIYQGDEIGLPDAVLTEEALRDPVGRRYWPHVTGRDPERSPLPWDDGPGRGFTTPGARDLAAHEHPDRVQRGRPARTIRVRSSPSPATSSPSVEPTPICTAAPTGPCPRPPTPGCGGGGTGSPPPSTSGPTRPPSRV